MADQGDKRLILHTQDTYRGSFSADLIEQYKLYVQSAENVSARRVASSRYLLTINAILAALYGLQFESFGQSYLTLPVPVIGITVSVLWYLIIKSHADMNKIKFDVIHQIEQHLPAAIYKCEWHLAERGEGETYRTVTTIERWIPVLFFIIHLALAVVIVLANLGLIAWVQ